MVDKKDSTQAGISLIELALFLPFIILIVAGIVDYGFALREVQAISSAAREGARLASSHSRIHHLIVPCNGSSSSAANVRCDATASGALVVNNTDPVDVAAKKATCGALRTQGIDVEGWMVKATVPAPVQEDGTDFDIVKVEIERNPDSHACVLCWEAILEAFRAKSESTFALESACSR